MSEVSHLLRSHPREGKTKNTHPHVGDFKQQATSACGLPRSTISTKNKRVKIVEKYY